MGANEVSRRAAGTDAASAALLGGLGLVLWLTGRSIAGQWLAAGPERGSPPFDQLMGLAASLLGLSILLWWSLCLTAAGTAALLYRRGHVRLGALVGRCSPAFLRRLALLAVGAQLLTAPVAASAMSAGPAVIPAAAAQPVCAPQVYAGWQPGEDSPRDPIRPHWKPRAPHPSGGLLVERHRKSEADESSQRRTVTVIAGDNLWTIAAAHLGPFATDLEIAQEWPRWYAANRQLLGDDPGLIYPGQVLSVPGIN